ncbi:MAG: DUF362 domain-containing protein [Candidatus Abyssobacteria bacterium SURF_17]|uniref:DUF362 domain-containing protein n=1 Tax=Candidatus Abyssobacteria bacterium SURF_17 TaxID=2093361 RepID=A0A419F8C9_9BACT|nr:MAG: DUF362 domain-containing protein [Candidatus Abyssubacteria bacterium SURF_17]
MTPVYHDEPTSVKLTRRAFLKDAALGATGAALGLTGCSPFAEAGHTPVPRAELPQGKSRVVLIREEEAFDADGMPHEERVEEILQRAMLELTGESTGEAAWSNFFKPEDIVGVKINVMMTPTSPELSRSVARGIMKAGVAEQNIILWDRNDAGYGLTGATVRDTKPGYDSKSLSRIVTEKATALVNVPGTKVHWLAGIGVALKNWVGAITNINVTDIGAVYKIHGDSCAECASIPAIPAIREKCRLVVVDALRPLFHGGPQVNPRYLWPYGGILVATDPVAADAVCMRILETKRREFKGGDWPINPPPKHVFLAEEKYRLGHANMDKIELVRLGWQEGMLV